MYLPLCAYVVQMCGSRLSRKNSSVYLQLINKKSRLLPERDFYF